MVGNGEWSGKTWDPGRGADAGRIRTNPAAANSVGESLAGYRYIPDRDSSQAQVSMISI